MSDRTSEHRIRGASGSRYQAESPACQLSRLVSLVRLMLVTAGDKQMIYDPLTPSNRGKRSCTSCTLCTVHNVRERSVLRFYGALMLFTGADDLDGPPVGRLDVNALNAEAWPKHDVRDARVDEHTPVGDPRQSAVSQPR